MMSLKRALAAICAVAVALAMASTTAAGGERKKVDVSLELVGQVMNPSPTTSLQYGYVAHLHGLPIFNGPAENASTARLSFFTDTTTLGVTVNGPLRIVTRNGTVTIYNDATPDGDFADRDSFRDGTPILVASLRQQVVINTVTNSFTTLNVNEITATTPFELEGERVRLGKVGQQFRTFLSGQSHPTPPPAAHIAGYTIPGASEHSDD
jgi:hypothetical protein